LVSGSLSSHRQLSTDVLPVHGWRPFYPRRARLYRPLPLVAGLNGLPRLLLTLGAVVVPQIIGLVLVVSLPSHHQYASCALWNFAGLFSRERCPARIRVRREMLVVIPRSGCGCGCGCGCELVTLETRLRELCVGHRKALHLCRSTP
jgi:hypothetical protein